MKKKWIKSLSYCQKKESLVCSQQQWQRKLKIYADYHWRILCWLKSLKMLMLQLFLIWNKAMFLLTQQRNSNYYLHFWRKIWIKRLWYSCLLVMQLSFIQTYWIMLIYLSKIFMEGKNNRKELQLILNFVKLKKEFYYAQMLLKEV